jgi:pimeloyl-ACP methyl ester carboxylesterase
MPKASVTKRAPGTPPPVRRGYFECRYGQLHVHNSMPPGGGFEEGTTLLCLHETPMTGRMFTGVLGLLARDRSVYAPDLPGYGDSEPPSSRPTIEDYAAAVGDFLDTMRFRQIDLLGCQTGALIAAELALARPAQVRRVVWSSVPVLHDSEREDFLRSPWPAPPDEDGSYLGAEWRRTAETAGQPVPLEVAARRLAESLRNGANASWGMHATVRYPARERLRLVTQPVLVLCPHDQFWEPTLRVHELLPKARIVDLPKYGTGWCEAVPEALVGSVAEFLQS